LSTLILGPAGTGDRTRANNVAGSGTSRSAIHYNFIRTLNPRCWRCSSEPSVSSLSPSLFVSNSLRNFLPKRNGRNIFFFSRTLLRPKSNAAERLYSSAAINHASDLLEVLKMSFAFKSGEREKRRKKKPTWASECRTNEGMRMRFQNRRGMFLLRLF
jgi:hypothetical protein